MVMHGPTLPWIHFIISHKTHCKTLFFCVKVKYIFLHASRIWKREGLIAINPETFMHPPVFYTRLPSPVGNLGLFATKKGICGLSFREKGFSHHLKRCAKIFNTPPVRKDERFHELTGVLDLFLRGRTDQINAPLDLTGLTPFQSHVLQVLQGIPYGTVRSYQWVAQRIRNPRACRAVGAACGANPVPLLIPCHRVIAKDGSLGGFSSGLRIKKWLLDLEKQSH
jgi:O-6-methylguanine DNA methyltransferase